MLRRQMSPWQLESVLNVHRNLPLKFHTNFGLLIQFLGPWPTTHPPTSLPGFLLLVLTYSLNLALKSGLSIGEIVLLCFPLFESLKISTSSKSSTHLRIVRSVTLTLSLMVLQAAILHPWAVPSWSMPSCDRNVYWYKPNIASLVIFFVVQKSALE